MGSMVKYFAQNKLFLNLLMITIFVSGLYSLKNIRREGMPSIETHRMVIKVVYPGASSTDVELNAVIPIEEELKSISGIYEYTSVAVENGASIYITIDEDVSNKRKVKDDIFRDISKGNIEDIPDEVDEIIIEELLPRNFPVYTFGLVAKKGVKISDSEIFRFADDFKKMLLKVKGVNDITLLGYREREIQINVSPDKMKEYYVSLNDIVGSIKGRNVRSTGGTLQSLDQQKNIVTIGQFENPLDVKDVIIRSGFEQKRLRIKDVASVKDDFEEATVKVKVNREKAVVLEVNKKENADIISTAKGVKSFIEDNRKMYEDRFDIVLVKDGTLQVNSLLKIVTSNAIMGFILIIIILFLFLDFRTSLWTALGIPISLFMVFSYMMIIDYSMNTITLVAFITVLGMLVDHGIVISEVIFTNRAKGMNSLDSAVEGVKEVFTPVTVTVLTTIVAFLPMLAIGGTIGNFIFVFPVIVTATLVASFFEATIILPGHLSAVKAPKKKGKINWFRHAESYYSVLLNWALKWRYVIILLFISFLIGTFFISRDTINDFVLMDDDSADGIYIKMEAERGTSLELTEKLTSDVEKYVMKHVPESERVSVLTTIGNHTSRGSSLGNHENWSQIEIILVPKGERERNADEIITDLRKDVNRKKLKYFTKLGFKKEEIGPPGGGEVDIKLIGNNETFVAKIQKDIENYLMSLSGVKDVDNDQKDGKPELKVVFDYDKLAQYGILVSEVANTVRTAYEGTVATYIQTAEERIEYRVKIEDTYQKTVEFLVNLLVPNNSGKLVRLGEFAKFKEISGKMLINHYNGDRAVTVTANVNTEIITPNQVAKMVDAKFPDLSKKYPGTYLIHGGEAEKTKETMGGVLSAFLMAGMLIYFILILLFKSFVQPIIIMLTIPFGLAGVLLTLTLHGMPMSFFAIIGSIGLMGVVINDSVIMVDFINKGFSGRKYPERQERHDFIVEGSKRRLRPVVLTTLTTVAALLPTVYGLGGDVRMLKPAVMAMAYGLLFASLITLVLIPVLYMINGDIKILLGRSR